MFRVLALCVAVACVMVPAVAQKESRPQAAASKAAVDKDALESYVRHLWVLGQDYRVSISDPKPSTDLPGFNAVTVHVAQGGATQDVPLFVSADGSKIVQGAVYDLKHNPFKPQLDALKTSFHPSIGTSGAPVVLAEFSDLECPHCKQQHDMLKENLLKTYPKEVRLYFMDFPLSIHAWARPAAIAGRCVFNQKPEAFWNYADSIFDRQESITPESFRSSVMEWAKSRQDIDALQLGRCMDEKSTEPDVDADKEQGRALGVDATPTLFINGRRVPASTDWDTMKRIIDLEIKYQAVAKNAGENCGCEVTLDAPGLPSKSSPIGPPGAKK